MSNDSKYGRLYPERAIAPARNILQAIIDGGEPSDSSLDEVQEALKALDELSFPPDEPLFLLRGQDTLAPEAVDNYANLVRHTPGAFGVGEESDATIKRIIDVAARMRRWVPRKLPD